MYVFQHILGLVGRETPKYRLLYFTLKNTLDPLHVVNPLVLLLGDLVELVLVELPVLREVGVRVLDLVGDVHYQILNALVYVVDARCDGFEVLGGVYRQSGGLACR